MCHPEFGSVLQSTVTLDNDSLVQVQDWDGKEAMIRRRLVDGKMVVVRSFSFFSLIPIASTRKAPKPVLNQESESYFSYKSWEETRADNK